jgi:hypothetical protein
MRSVTQMMNILQSAGSGLLESVSQIAVVAGSLLLVGMLVGFGAFAYKQVLGDGIEWPDEQDGHEAESDDEWDYY